MLDFEGKAQHLALEAGRQRQQTQAFKEQYAARSGVEGTISEAVFALGMRRARFGIDVVGEFVRRRLIGQIETDTSVFWAHP